MSNLFINIGHRKNIINKNIYGHFAEHLGRCIYEGIYVGEGSEIPNVNGIRRDVADALRHIRVPVLRWPGGCFADEYHWKDGVGPKEKRKKMVNTHWGGVVEDNSFGTHEFMELCNQIDCEPYISGNLGSGTVQEMSEWVEYLTFGGLSPMSDWRAENGRKEPWKVKYFGVGNENWGCGGNMRPEYYADEYRRYQTYVRNYGENKIYKIACGSTSYDYDWTEKLMSAAGKYMDALTLHHYTLPTGNWDKKGGATGFTEREYYQTVINCLKMDELISNHLQIMNRYDPEHRVGLIVDEWGTWYDAEPGTNPGFLYQQNTMRDAVVAAATLNIFNKYSGRVVMANIAQTVNVLQAIILTDGAKMVLTPTYHVFDLFKAHQDAALVDSYLEPEFIDFEGASIPRLSASASVDAGGALNITAANLSMKDSALVECDARGIDITSAEAKLLSARAGAYNTFDRPGVVKLRDADVKITNGKLFFEIPSNSVMHISVR
ncbi:MAG: alpha-N-arabinofuranosidase [Defluviitaleaceae bacterium]|nr:alpha-N-arabinofuranosidase [Defluviitaleaceae bacterium]MCL2835840.1 alpha-N-arabinofuranosidase [Defluviitaleaceae bacterium]